MKFQFLLTRTVSSSSTHGKFSKAGFIGSVGSRWPRVFLHARFAGLAGSCSMGLKNIGCEFTTMGGRHSMRGRIRKAVIPAAGLGTRFLPATKAQPKEMLPIVDKPTIQYIIEEAVASGIEDILIITGRGKRAIEDHFDKSVELEVALEEKGQDELLEQVREISDLAAIHYVRQKEPLGLGHAISCARSFVGGEPFAVLLGDDVIDSETPCLQQLIERFEQENGASILGVQPVPWEHV